MTCEPVLLTDGYKYVGRIVLFSVSKLVKILHENRWLFTLIFSCSICALFLFSYPLFVLAELLASRSNIGIRGLGKEGKKIYIYKLSSYLLIIDKIRLFC